MKGLMAVFAAIVILLAGMPDMASSSSHEKNRGDNYGHDERYESKFYGVVTKIPEGGIGTWIVSDREVIVTKNTFIEEEHGRAAAGAYVKVEGSHTDNTFNAYKIEVKRAKR